MAGTVVIGAGLSGLTAAYRLVQAGADPRVLEARRRVGGRAWRFDVGGVPFDAGCEALDGSHEALLSLARELGVAVRRGEAWRAGCEPELHGPDAELFLALAEEIGVLARRVDPLAPQDLEGAGELDRETLASWLAGRGASPRVLAAAEAWYSVASASVPLSRMSLLALASKVAAGATGPFDLRFEGGPSALAERLAEALGDRVRLGAEAVAVEQGERGVRVVLSDTEHVDSRRAVLAVPLGLQRRLRFDPPLPAHRRLAFARMRYGDVVKAALSYDGEPDAPAPSLTGKGLVYRPAPGVPVLALFAGEPAAGRLVALPRGEREKVIAGLVGGEPRAVRAVAWSEERFTLGSYLIFGPGDLTEWGTRLSEPHGRVHFAGSEASPLPSYMNGAVVAGERAAAEILAAG